MRLLQLRAGIGRSYVLIVLGVLLLMTPFGCLAVVGYLIQRSENRVRDMKNLSIFGKAAHLFHDEYGYLPPVVGFAAGKNGTVHYHLLPYFDQAQAYANGDMGAEIPVFWSPNESSAPRDQVFDGLRATNYAANWQAFHGGPTPSGKTTFKDSFPDGASQTLLFTTRYRLCNGTPTLWGHAKLDTKAPMIGYANRSLFQMQPSQTECDPTLAQALQSNGIRVALADASARNVTSGISAQTWAAVLTPAGNDVPGPDWVE